MRGPGSESQRGVVEGGQVDLPEGPERLVHQFSDRSMGLWGRPEPEKVVELPQVHPGDQSPQVGVGQQVGRGLGEVQLALASPCRVLWPGPVPGVFPLDTGVMSDGLGLLEQLARGNRRGGGRRQC